jgi:tetratricopeptide (TPR) repeat protein
MYPRVLSIASISLLLFAASAANAGSPTSDIDVASLLKRAYAHQSQGNFSVAITDYGTALKDGGLDKKLEATVYYNRGLAHYNNGAVREAIADFTAALFANRDLAQAYYARANALKDNGNLLFALSDYEKASLHGYPERHLPLFGQALVYEQLNRPLKAEAFLQQVLAAKPGFGPAARKLAEIRAGFKTAQATTGSTTASGPVFVSSQSYFGIISDRIDSIITNAISPVAPDQVVRKAELPQPVRPPRHLIDAAAEVEVATMQLPGLRTMSIAQTPGYVAPGFIVTQTSRFQKLQDRIGADGVAVADGSGGTEDGVRVEPVSAPVEFTTRTERAAQTEAAEEANLAASEPAETAPVAGPTGWLVQVNSQKSETAAWAAWESLKSKHKLLADRTAIVQKADLGDGKVVYRVRVRDLATQKDAKSFCAGLKSAGVGCFVSRAEG